MKLTGNHIENRFVIKSSRNLIIMFDCFYLFLYIVWNVFQIYFLRVDAGGRTITFLSIVALMVNVKMIARCFFRRSNTACWLWFSLMFFSALNSIVMGIPSDASIYPFFCENYFHPMCFVLISFCMLSLNRKRTLIVMLGALLFYVFTGMIFIENISIGDERILNDKLGNLLPLLSVSLLLVSSLLYRDRIIKASFIPIVLLAFSAIMLSATRKAFVAMIIIIIGLIISGFNKHKLFNNIIVSFSFIVLLVAIVYVYSNTLVGKRFDESFANENKYQLVEDKTMNDVLNGLLGDRAYSYYAGTLLFLKYPINGIGLGNYKDYTNDIYRLHSEYLVQLCENGIIGFSMLMSVIIVVLRRLIKLKDKPRTYPIVLAGFIAIIMMNVTAWTYCALHALIINSIVLSFIYSETGILIISKKTN